MGLFSKGCIINENITHERQSSKYTKIGGRWRLHEIFKIGMQVLGVFLDGDMHAAVSGLAHFVERKLHFLLAQTQGPANVDWLKKVKCYLQLAAFFSMTIQIPQILALLTREGFIMKARWWIITGTEYGPALLTPPFSSRCPVSGVTFYETYI
jgi:hypothetical protein